MKTIISRRATKMSKESPITSRIVKSQRRTIRNLQTNLEHFIERIQARKR
jgi:hypothetical protein